MCSSDFPGFLSHLLPRLKLRVLYYLLHRNILSASKDHSCSSSLSTRIQRHHNTSSLTFATLGICGFSTRIHKSHLRGHKPIGLSFSKPQPNTATITIVSLSSSYLSSSPTAFTLSLSYVVNTNDDANNYMIVLFDCGQNVVKRRQQGLLQRVLETLLCCLRGNSSRLELTKVENVNKVAQTR